ncbi:hypothetical protein B0H10DRAFT_1960140 [Mycena sp. CBHHK59/15]|nr:hypothetical protein B0H10DRAFT_1960140 [Mycena sp. CBHHK59/15]
MVRLRERGRMPAIGGGAATELHENDVKAKDLSYQWTARTGWTSSRSRRQPRRCISNRTGIVGQGKAHIDCTIEDEELGVARCKGRGHVAGRVTGWASGKTPEKFIVEISKSMLEMKRETLAPPGFTVSESEDHTVLTLRAEILKLYQAMGALESLRQKPGLGLMPTARAVHG